MSITLVTGVAGFIGMHVAEKLLKRGDTVIGIDNLNDYYDIFIKFDRLQKLKKYKNFIFRVVDISDNDQLGEIFKKHSIERIINLAAQAGVRYSIQNPMAYINSNLVGFANIIEAAKNNNIKNFVYASSSSVYGSNEKIPFTEIEPVDHPLSLYAATKRSNELIAHSYSNIHSIPTTGLRFFTVYGPWGRPDMALFIFAKAILEGRPIVLFNNGNMVRDFTYIDDISDGIIAAVDNIPQGDTSNIYTNTSRAPFRIYNLGSSQRVDLRTYVNLLEENLNKKAIIKYAEMQPGDVPITESDISLAKADLSYSPKTSVTIGIPIFAKWFKEKYDH
jgi:UDP-glucuronate 4-epimerase